jgi:hypothetical protein
MGRGKKSNVLWSCIKIKVGLSLSSGRQIVILPTFVVLETPSETSPLSRPVKQTNVENSTILTSYGVNLSNEVRKFASNGSILVDFASKRKRKV